MEPIKYHRILRQVYGADWAIVPERMQDILDVLAFQSTGGKLTAEEVRELVGLGAVRPSVPAQRGTVALLPVRGIISHRVEMVNEISGPGGTSMEKFRDRFRSVVDNENVDAVVLDVDSPGGAVSGVPEMADEIFKARGKKPIVAVANTLAGSAAYWLASQADEVSVTPSGEVGSIGVIAAHREESEALSREGIRVNLIHFGEFKTEGNPFEPLTSEARENIQQRVDIVGHKFVETVARGRGVAVGTVTDKFGKGRLVDAETAVSAGMADRIETLEQAIQRVAGSVSDMSRRRRRRSEALAKSFVFLPSHTVPR